MNLQEGKTRFIEAWGTLGSRWGITRTMAQIHALLLISEEPLCSDDVMKSLQISRGNVNLNMRMLVDWGLAHKKLVVGSRKEYFVAEKDLVEALKRIVAERKKRELDPMLRLFDELSTIKSTDEETNKFKAVINELKDYSQKADAAMTTFSKMDSDWINASILMAIDEKIETS